MIKLKYWPYWHHVIMSYSHHVCARAQLNSYFYVSALLCLEIQKYTSEYCQMSFLVCVHKCSGLLIILLLMIPTSSLPLLSLKYRVVCVKFVYQVIICFQSYSYWFILSCCSCCSIDFHDRLLLIMALNQEVAHTS